MLFNFKSIAYAGAITLLCFTSLQANAGLIIDTDHDSFIDTGTGLEWMDFGINAGKSFNDVASQLNGGIYNGWALATLEQAIGVFESIADRSVTAGKSSNSWSWTQGVLDQQLQMNEMIGFNTGSSTPARLIQNSIGLFLGTDGLSSMEFRVSDSLIGNVPFSDMTSTRWRDDVALDMGDNVNELYSTMLVRAATPSSSVPEPTNMVLFSLGLMGLAFRKFKKKS